MVEVGGFALSAFRHALTGDVADRPDHVRGAPLFVDQDDSAVAHQDEAAVASGHAVLALIDAAALRRAPVVEQRLFAVVCMNASQPAVEVSRQDTRLEPEQRVHLTRHLHVAGLDVPVVVGVEHGVDEGSQAHVTGGRRWSFTHVDLLTVR